jgi:hypothetical protein
MVKTNMPASRKRARLFLLTLALGLLLSSCEFLGLDIFPAALQNAHGSIDLDSRVAAQDGAVISYVQGIERLSSSATGKAYLFVLCGTDLGTRLIVLDPDSLATVAYLSDSRIGTPLAVDANGSFVSGSVLIDGGFAISTNPYTSLSGKMAVLTTTLAHLVLHTSNGLLNYDERSADWTVSNNAYSKVISTEYAYYLVDAAAPSDGGLRLLFRNNGSGALAFSFTSIINLSTAISASTPANLYDWVVANPSMASVTKLSNANDSRSWLCASGIVAPSYDKESRLVRYGYATGASLDSRLFRSDWARGLSFDYGEKGWYYYDSRSGRLYAMGVWW